MNFTDRYKKKKKSDRKKVTASKQAFKIPFLRRFSSVLIRGGVAWQCGDGLRKTYDTHPDTWRNSRINATYEFFFRQYIFLGDVNGTLVLTSMFFLILFDNKIDWSRDQNETGESNILFQWEPSFWKIE